MTRTPPVPSAERARAAEQIGKSSAAGDRWRLARGFRVGHGPTFAEAEAYAHRLWPDEACMRTRYADGYVAEWAALDTDCAEDATR